MKFDTGEECHAYITGQSRAWFESQPRHLLGIFASTNMDLLVDIESKYRYARYTLVHGLDHHFVVNGLLDKSQTVKVGPNEPNPLDLIIDINKARGEVDFWYKVSGDFKAPIIGVGQKAWDWSDKLKLVYDNPTMLRYFEAGFWDMELIENLVANNIDAGMAATVNGRTDLLSPTV